MRSWHIFPIRNEAAQCELDGPLITGPTTSLKMLGYCMDQVLAVNHGIYEKNPSL